MDRSFTMSLKHLCSLLFPRDRRGVVAPLVITLLPAALGGTALAVDAGFFYVQDQRVQVAADAAAMGVSKILASNPTTAQMQAAALQAVDDMTGGNMAGTIQTPISVTQTSTGVTVTVSSKSNDFFGGALGVVAPTLSTTAVVKQISSSSASGTSCVLALNTSSTAVEVSGGATVTLDSGGNCAVRSNGGFLVTGGGTLVTAGLYTGGTIVNNWATIKNSSGGTPTEVQNDGTLTDPYLSNTALQTALTTVATSSTSNVPSPGGGAKITLSPGYYGSWNVSNGTTWTLNPGTYYVNGSFSTGGGATITGTNVTIIVSGAINFAGGSTITLSAPTTASGVGIAGIVIAGSTSSTTSLTGGASSKLTGVVYLPNSTVDISGGTNTGSTGTCLEMVAQTFSFTGGAGFGSSCASYGAANIPTSGGSTSTTYALSQ
jgi:Flp pilus assembly protein TadG